MDQIGGDLLGKETDHNDSFEKYYNKDLDLEEGKHKATFDNHFNACRLSANRYLRAVWVSNQLHFTRVVWKGADVVAEGSYDAWTDLS